jgi:hypothetical protein
MLRGVDEDIVVPDGCKYEPGSNKLQAVTYFSE